MSNPSSRPCICTKCGYKTAKVLKDDTGYGFCPRCNTKMRTCASLQFNRKLDKAKEDYEKIILLADAIALDTRINSK